MRFTERFIDIAIGAVLGAVACFVLLMAIDGSAEQRAEIKALRSQLEQRDNDLQAQKKTANDAAENFRDRIAALQRALNESETKNGTLKNERDAFETQLTRVEAKLRAKTVGPDAAQLTRFNRTNPAGARDNSNAVPDIELEEGRFRFTNLELSKTDDGCQLSGQIVSSKNELEPVGFRVAFYDEKDELIATELFLAELPNARQPKAFEKRISDAPGRKVSRAFRFKISFEPG